MRLHILIVICLLAAVSTSGSQPTGPTDAQLDARAAELRKELPDEFSVVIAKPFVVVGDEPSARVKRRAEQTVAWSVGKLKAQYFKNDPDRVIDIYLFKDKASYEKHCKGMFGMKPHTPYGFYSQRHNALIMNIATGGGTLVHEIVHPYVEANFPECPAWFNEGLGSLYEQSSERNGKIIGKTNWRLAGLQQAIKKDSLPTFKQLCSTSTKQFYNLDRGTNYAQARYLCYYLQEKGLLEKYYAAFVANVDDDPTGYKTLTNILGTEDMAAFQRDWQKWVMKLTFP